MNKLSSTADVLCCIETSQDEDCYGVSQSGSSGSGNKSLNFFDLPYHIKVDILSRLSMEDTLHFSATCRQAHTLTQEQAIWEEKLWRHAKALNLSFGKCRRKKLLPASDLLVKDPLLVDMRRLYEVLNPSRCNFGTRDELNFENLLSKIETPSSFSGIGMSEVLEFLNSIFSRPAPQSYTDPFTRGNDAPTFLLFGPPETKASKRVALSFIASKDATFETIGLVKGKPGGIGGGVTVQYGRNVMNILPVRRARPRLLFEGENGTEFHNDVAKVAAQVDGLIYYLDAKCNCNLEKTKQKTDKNGQSGGFKGDQHDNNIQHDLSLDTLELEAMLRSLPSKKAPPIFILLAVGHIKPTSIENDTDNIGAEETPKECSRVHSPADFYEMLQSVDLPWIICNVDVQSLDGVHQGLNWLLQRTRLTKGL